MDSIWQVHNISFRHPAHDPSLRNELICTVMVRWARENGSKSASDTKFPVNTNCLPNVSTERLLLPSILIYETGALKALEPINQVPVEHHVLVMFVEGVNQDCELGTL